MIEAAGLIDGDPVVSGDEEAPAGLEGWVDLAQALDEVPGEGVVVVEEEDQETPDPRDMTASMR